MSYKQVYYTREFLNDQQGLAAFMAEITSSGPYRGTEEEKSKVTYVDATVTISDCNRQISLDFSFQKKNKEERIAKIQKLIDKLEEVKSAMNSVHVDELSTEDEDDTVSSLSELLNN